MPVGASHPAIGTQPLVRDRGFWVLFVCLFNNGVANSMLFAILPALSVELGMPAVAVGAIYVVAAALFTIMSQVWGRMSDRVGRRPLIILGLCGAAASMWAMAETIGLARAGVVGVGLASAMMIGSRAIFGLLNSASGPGAIAWVSDRTTPAERTRAVALMTSAFGLGAACGPMFAGQLAPALGYAGPLVVTGVIAALGALGVALFVEDQAPRASKSRDSLWRHFARMGDPRLRDILGASFLMWLVQASALQTVGFAVMDRIGAAPDGSVALTGIVLTGGALAALAAQLVVIPVFNVAARTAMIAGAGVGALGAGMMIVATTLPVMVFAFVVMSLGVGLARPGASAAASLAVTPHEQGMASGLVAATAGAGFFVSPAIGTGLYMLGGGAASFAAMLACASGAAVIAQRSAAIAANSSRAGA